MAGPEITVTGLKDFARELKATDFKGEIGRINQAAAKPVAVKAQALARARGGSAAKGAKTIKASRAQAKVTIGMGGKAAPWMWGSEFGAKQFKQFPRWKGNQFQVQPGGTVGYILHPVLRRDTKDFEVRWWSEIEKLAAAAFPD